MPQIHMIPGSGVNLEKHYFEEYPSYETPISFLFLGRLMQHKGVGELLEAASIIGKKYPEVKFRLAGFFEEEYRQILDTFPRYPNVEYLGYRQDVHPLLKECHAIVLPSYHEGLANVLLEAAATGRPVLASNIPGCMETFVEGVSGMGFRPRDGIDLSDKLEQFIRLPYEKKREMGLEGRKKIAREFDRNFVVDAYAEEIQQILGQEETRAYDMV